MASEKTINDAHGVALGHLNETVRRALGEQLQKELVDKAVRELVSEVQTKAEREQQLRKAAEEAVNEELYQEMPPIEYGWLVERDGPDGVPEWLYVTEDGKFEWTTTSIKALRLSRKRDAQQLGRYVGTPSQPTQHSWG